MITPSHVRANVVDVYNMTSALPSLLAADANVLYWIFYPNFGSLTAAGGRGPAPYQLNDYAAYWARAAAKGCQFLTANVTIGEFAKTSEHSELEALWRVEPVSTRPNPNPANRFDARVCKSARYYFAANLPTIRSDIKLTITSMLRSVRLLDIPATTAATQHDSVCTTWLGSLGDFPDASLISTALAQGVTSFLSDDADLATFPGIKLYTANRHTIGAARSAGKLV